MPDTPAPYEDDLTLEQARELMDRGLRPVLMGILRDSCAPLFWADRDVRKMLHNGTMTLKRYSKGVLGITAGHVMRQFLADSERLNLQVQLYEAQLPDLHRLIIDIDDGLDLATIHLPDDVLRTIGKVATPISTELQVPTEGRGLMLAGYPGSFRRDGDAVANFGLVTVLGVARTVTQTQITWLHEDRLDHIDYDETGGGPIDLGGMSGGPCIAAFASPAGVFSHSLCGIVTEAPKLRDPDTLVPKVAAVRADFITDTGSIRHVP